MKCNRLLGPALFASTLAYSTYAMSADLPDPSQVYIRGVNASGTGCEPASYAVNLSSDKRAFTVTFSEFVAEVGPGLDLSASRKACSITLDLNVPAGWQYSIGTFNYRGFMDLEDKVQAEHTTNYFFQGVGQTGNFTYVEKGPLAKDFVYTDKIGLTSVFTPDTWSPCNEQRALTINPSIYVRKLAGAAENAQGIITNDSVDGEVSQVFGMAWKRCGSTTTTPAPEIPTPTPPTPNPETLVSGTIYNLISRPSGKCLDTKDHSLVNSGVYQQYSCDGGAQQRFVLTDLGRGLYSLKGVESGKMVSLRDSNQADGGIVHQYDNYNAPNQKVRLTPSAEGSYRLAFEHSGKCIDVAGESLANGAKIQQWVCNGQANQDWFFQKAVTPTPSSTSYAGTYSLVGRYSNKCLDVQNGTQENGALTQQWQCGDKQPNQRFRLTPAGKDTYTLIAEHSNKCLSVRDSNQANLTSIIQWDCWNSANQLVTVKPSTNGSVTIRFTHSNKCMDVAGTSDANGQLVHQYECLGISDQDWFLRK